MKGWKGTKRRMLCLLMALILFGGIFAPGVSVEAASVKVVYKNKTKTYSSKKSSIVVNSKKTGLSKTPIFKKDGAYMGPATTIFKNSTLKVGYKDVSHTTLTLTYQGKTLKMTNGKKIAQLNGKKTELGSAPMYVKYKSSGKSRWIVPIKSVCSRFGMSYKLGSDGVIRITGNANKTTSTSTTASSSNSNKVKVVVSGSTKTYDKKKTSVLVNNKTISLTRYPVFLKEDSYVGPAYQIFKSSSLGLEYSDSNHKTLTLKYNGHTLVMTNGNKKAKLDGKTTEFGTAPIYAKYSESNESAWIVPIKSICTRLGITYSLGNDEKIRLSGSKHNPKTKLPATTTTQAPGNVNNDKKIVVVLDAGHGKQDAGASANGQAEKNLTLSILLAAKAKFDADSRFKVYYTRTSDTYPSLTDRSDLANNMGADFFISIHINSYAKTSTGTETLYNPDRLSKTKKNNLTSVELATQMNKYAVAATGFTNRGLKQRTDLSVLNRTNMPACLIEYGFITNPTECKKMVANTTKYGQALYNGVVDLMKAKGRIK